MQNTARMRLANLSLDGNDQPVLFKHEPKVMAKKLFVELSPFEQETLSGGAVNLFSRVPSFTLKLLIGRIAASLQYEKASGVMRALMAIPLSAGALTA